MHSCTHTAALHMHGPRHRCHVAWRARARCVGGDAVAVVHSEHVLPMCKAKALRRVHGAGYNSHCSLHAMGIALAPETETGVLAGHENVNCCVRAARGPSMSSPQLGRRDVAARGMHGNTATPSQSSVASVLCSCSDSLVT